MASDVLYTNKDIDIGMNAGDIDATSEMNYEHNANDYGSRHIIGIRDDSRLSFDGRTPKQAIKMLTPFNR